MALCLLNAATEGEIDAAFTSLEELQAGGLVVNANAFLTPTRASGGAGITSCHSVPAIYADRLVVTAGGLISYAMYYDAARRQAGIYAGRILKGANRPICRFNRRLPSGW